MSALVLGVSLDALLLHTRTLTINITIVTTSNIITVLNTAIISVLLSVFWSVVPTTGALITDLVVPIVKLLALVVSVYSIDSLTENLELLVEMVSNVHVVVDIPVASGGDVSVNIIINMWKESLLIVVHLVVGVLGIVAVEESVIVVEEVGS